MPISHQYTADGFYYGAMEDGGFPPNNSTHVAPPPWPWRGQWPRWNGTAWEMVEDHRERDMPGLEQPATDYWLPGDDHTTPARHMSKPGSLPEGALLVKPAAPEPTAAERAAARRAEIVAALDALDARGARAARAVALAVAAGDTPSPADVDKLTALETDARALRAELAELQEG